MKKITFKSVESIAKWIIRQSKKLDDDARIIVSENLGSERIKLVNELVKNGLPLKSLNDEGGVLFISADGVSFESEGNERDSYDIIMIHAIEKLKKATVMACGKKCKKLVRFVFEGEEDAHKKALEELRAKKAEMSKKENLKLPEGFTVREDRHGLSYKMEDENKFISYSYYTSDELDDECLKKIADSVVGDLI